MSENVLRTLRCPHCGAPLPTEALKHAVTCAFCGTASVPAPELRTAARPVSPATPAPSVASQVIDASELACPRCDLPLFEGKANEVTMLGCGGCGGIWLENASARRALATFDAEVTRLADRASTRARTHVDQRPLLRCPACQGTLARVSVSRENVHVDVCAEHGTWFDQFELGLILAALQPGRAPAQPGTYDGPIPDFRKGANPELREFGKVFGMGVLAIVGGLAGGAVAGAAGSGKS